MRLKYQSLIALGISSVIFSGCSTGSGGFLNLGIGNALQKTKICAFKNKLTYEQTPIGSTGLSLPTFGSAPTNIGHQQIGHQQINAAPAPISNYSVMQAPVAAPAANDCGCNANSATTSPSYVQEYYMPVSPVQVDTVPSAPTMNIESQPVDIVEPPIESVRPGSNGSNELPPINVLPGEFEQDSGSKFDSLDETDSLGPTGSKADDGFSLETGEDNSDKVVDGLNHSSEDKSILESAKRKRLRSPDTDKITRPSQQIATIEDVETKMVTLHARPAQSHNVFDRASQQRKALETMQASHKNQFRQQNSLRQPQLPAMNTNYRQASNTDGAIEFKPLPPVNNEVIPTPKTNLQPLQESEETRFAETLDNHTAALNPAASRRVPLLRATTASSASILSLKNLANVISDEDQKSYYRRTADENGRTPADSDGTRLK